MRQPIPSPYPAIREDFPFLKAYPKLAYLDNAATTQKPQVVLDALASYYQAGNANIHRGIYSLAAKATQAYETARDKVQTWLGAAHREEIIFTKGTTEAINMVAFSYLGSRLQAGEEVLISEMEHHANLIPWQQLCIQKKAKLQVIPMREDGTLDWALFPSLLTEKTRLLALAHISNTLGTIHPIEQAIQQAHAKGIPVLIDGAQSAAHAVPNLQDLNADFYTFSGHKLYGPTGIGVLYGKKEHLEAMQPYLYGGDMIRKVSLQETTFAPLPNKLEAGTPHIAGAVGLGAALDYLQALDKSAVQTYLAALTQYAREQVGQVEGLTIYGPTQDTANVFSFGLEGVHPHDLATMLDSYEVAIRAGQHCTQPLLEKLGVPATARVSFGLYNRPEEVDQLVQALREIKAFFA
ncbi:MAG: SufS family cysteine desulfurase [Bacteroidota bacterium]